MEYHSGARGAVPPHAPPRPHLIGRRKARRLLPEGLALHVLCLWHLSALLFLPHLDPAMQ